MSERFTRSRKCHAPHVEQRNFFKILSYGCDSKSSQATSCNGLLRTSLSFIIRYNQLEEDPYTYKQKEHCNFSTIEFIDTHN